MPIVIIEIRNTGGEPVPTVRAANQEHGARAIRRWYRHQHVVDLEVAVSLQRDTGKGAAVFNERSRGFTNQRGKHASASWWPSDAIAASQDKPLPFDLDVPIIFYLGLEVLDPPDLTGRIDSTDSVSVDRNSARGCVHDYVRDGDNSDSPLESHQGIIMLTMVIIIGYCRQNKKSSYEDDEDKDEQTLFHERTSISIFFSWKHLFSY